MQCRGRHNVAAGLPRLSARPGRPCDRCQTLSGLLFPLKVTLSPKTRPRIGKFACTSLARKNAYNVLAAWGRLGGPTSSCNPDYIDHVVHCASAQTSRDRSEHVIAVAAGPHSQQQMARSFSRTKRNGMMEWGWHRWYRPGPVTCLASAHAAASAPLPYHANHSGCHGCHASRPSVASRRPVARESSATAEGKGGRG